MKILLFLLFAHLCASRGMGHTVGHSYRRRETIWWGNRKGKPDKYVWDRSDKQLKMFFGSHSKQKCRVDPEPCFTRKKRYIYFNLFTGMTCVGGVLIGSSLYMLKLVDGRGNYEERRYSSRADMYQDS
jgi:hypothetical protein